ncbi:hypothetical protein GCM10020331_044500 [Ectobacillus funiculus]
MAGGSGFNYRVFLAKEVVVSTMTIIYKTPNIDALQASMGQFFTPLGAYSFLVFVLLYIPCLATVAVIQKETASHKWTLFFDWLRSCVGVWTKFPCIYRRKTAWISIGKKGLNYG